MSLIDMGVRSVLTFRASAPFIKRLLLWVETSIPRCPFDVPAQTVPKNDYPLQLKGIGHAIARFVASAEPNAPDKKLIAVFLL